MNEDRIKNIVDNIISRDEFQPDKPADLSWLKNIREFLSRIIEVVFEFIANIIRTIFDKLSHLFKLDSISFNNMSSIVRNIIYIVGFLITIGLIALLVFLIVKIIRRLDKEKINSDNFSDELIAFIDEPEKPYDMAKLYFNEEKYRLSFRYLFLSLLVVFNQKEMIEIHISKTNRQYLYELKYNNISFYDLTEPFFKSFDLIWYGGRSLSLEDYLIWNEKYDDIIKKLSFVKKEANDE